jgi:hypothetical protein
MEITSPEDRFRRPAQALLLGQAFVPSSNGCLQAVDIIDAPFKPII